MNVVRAVLKELGGRMENAAGAINSEDNMFAGSSGNALSDKVTGDKETTNPVADPNEGTTEETVTAETKTPDVKENTVDTTEMKDEVKEVYSDEKLKGKLKNLDLSIKAKTPNTGNSSVGGMGKSVSFGGGSAEGTEAAEGAADVGADAGDMADVADAASDQRLKNIFGDNEDAIECFAKINAIKFTYNDKAKEIPDGKEKGIDDDPHYGVKAQEIAENPLTASAVKRDPISDYLTIDIKELTTANTAIISEICKRILIIEKLLGIKVV